MVSFFSKFFPTPKYLTRPAVGLDISDQSIKFMGLERRHGRLAVVKYGEKALPVGVIDSGLIKDSPALTSALVDLKKEFNLSDVTVSLPEEEAYVIRLSLPDLKPAELRESLELQLEEHIPLAAEEVVFDYEVLSAPANERGEYDLSVSVFPKSTIVAYSDALAAAELTPLAFEIEAQAIARSVIPSGDKRLIMIVDFGKTRSSFFIARGAVVLFTTTVQHLGGEDLTKAIQKNLNVGYVEAEKLKIEKGLLGGQTSRELFFALLPLVSVLRDEIIKHYSWWESRRRDGHSDQSVEQIIICGGQATLPGLVDYLNLDWPTKLGNPWTNVFSFEEHIPLINFNQALRYTTSLGLGLRGLLPEP